MHFSRGLLLVGAAVPMLLAATPQRDPNVGWWSCHGYVMNNNACTPSSICQIRVYTEPFSGGSPRSDEVQHNYRAKFRQWLLDNYADRLSPRGSEPEWPGCTAYDTEEQANRELSKGASEKQPQGVKMESVRWVPDQTK